MMKQTIKILGKYLNGLEENDLGTFKKMFCKMKPPRGKKKILTRLLEKKSTAEIAEKIVQSYTVRYGPSHVIKVLKKMSLNQTKIELWKDLKQARNKCKEKRSNAKVQVAEGGKANFKKNTSQKKSSNVEAQDGVPTSPQTPREVNSRVPKPCSAQEDGRKKNLKHKDNQEESNNVPRRVDPQITKPDTCQDTSGIPISLTDQNEGKTYITRLETEEVGNTKATQKFRNSDLQEQNQNQGDPKDDVCIGEGIDEQPKIEATTVKLRKRPAQNKSMGKKQEQVQLKSPTAKPKQTRKAKQGGKHFVDQHRVKLIEKVTNVEPVLDYLMDEDILTSEQYDNVRKGTTNQDKMRTLYTYMRGWGTPEKDTFHSLLKKHNSVLIKDLNRQNKQKK